MYSYSFKAMARYQKKDDLEEFNFNTYARTIGEAYRDIKATADRVCCEYHNLRLVKITTVANKEDDRELIWQEVDGKNDYPVYNKSYDEEDDGEAYSYTFNALSKYQEKDTLENSEFNTFAKTVGEAYMDIKENADRVCCEYINLRLVKITTIPDDNDNMELLWQETEGIYEYPVYSKSLYMEVQAKSHKSKRINKKWAKKYGFKTVKNNSNFKGVSV